MKVLILMFGRIGDMVLATPAFKLIKEKFPDAIIDVIASRHNFTIARQNVYINNVILWNNFPTKLLKAFWHIKSVKYNFYIDPKDHYSWHSKFIALNCRANKKIWFTGNKLNKCFHHINVLTLNKAGYTHFTDLMIAALLPMGISNCRNLLKPQLFVNQNSELHINSFLKEYPVKMFVLVNISSGKNGMESSRTWQTEKWEKLIEAITSENFDVVINAIHAETIIANAIADRFANVFVPVIRNIDDLFSLTKRALLVISPDTSVVHISAAFDKPLIAFYSNHPSNIKRFYPSNSKAEVLIAKNESGQVKDIEVEDALNAFNSLMKIIPRNKNL